MVGASASLDQGVEVKLVDDQAGVVTDVVVGADLAALFAYSRAWAADVKPEDVDLSFSSMLAAMVGDEQPLCRWLVGFFDRLGVKRSDITKDRVYRHRVLPAGPSGPPELVTTYSFREAWAKALEVRDLTSPGQSVSTRHFMAAYAASPAYHLEDFRKHRIDRREWCLELVDELSLRFPRRSRRLVALRGDGAAAHAVRLRERQLGRSGSDASQARGGVHRPPDRPAEHVDSTLDRRLRSVGFGEELLPQPGPRGCRTAGDGRGGGRFGLRLPFAHRAGGVQRLALQRERARFRRWSRTSSGTCGSTRSTRTTKS